MPKNKNAMIRYLYLDKLFQRQGYSIDEIRDRLNDYLYDYDNSSVSKNTVLADIEFMESVAGWRIELKRWREGHKVMMCYKDRNFSIMEMPLTQEQAKQLSRTIAMLDGIKGLPNFRWMEPMLAMLKEQFGIDRTPKGTVSLAQNENLQGLEWFGKIYDAIVEGRVVEVQYQRFGGKTAKGRTVVPHQLKQYNNRWYVVGTEEAKQPRHRFVVVPLDRIVELKVKSGRQNAEPTPSAKEIREYFSHIVGVSLLPEGKVQEVVLKARKPEAWYIQTKPVHQSQEVIEEDDEAVTFRLEVIPNEELVQQLMVYADVVEVMRPASLRKEMRERAESILALNK